MYRYIWKEKAHIYYMRKRLHWYWTVKEGSSPQLYLLAGEGSLVESLLCSALHPFCVHLLLLAGEGGCIGGCTGVDTWVTHVGVLLPHGNLFLGVLHGHVSRVVVTPLRHCGWEREREKMRDGLLSAAKIAILTRQKLWSTVLKWEEKYLASLNSYFLKKYYHWSWKNELIKNKITNLVSPKNGESFPIHANHIPMHSLECR